MSSALIAQSVSAIADKGAQSTQVNPSCSDSSRVLSLAIGAILNLGYRVGHAGKFGPQLVFEIIAISIIEPPLIKLVSTTLNFIVECRINGFICID
jgi:hypothetical protein